MLSTHNQTTMDAVHSSKCCDTGVRSTTETNDEYTTADVSTKPHHHTQHHPLFPQFPSLQQLFMNSANYQHNHHHHHHCLSNNCNSITSSTTRTNQQQLTPGPLIAPSFVVSSTSTTTARTNVNTNHMTATQPAVTEVPKTKATNPTMCIDYRSMNTDAVLRCTPETIEMRNEDDLRKPQTTTKLSSSTSFQANDTINKKKARIHEASTVKAKTVTKTEEKSDKPSKNDGGISSSSSSGNNASRLNKFVKRLHDMLLHERASGLVQWKRGLLVLHDTKVFAKSILPKYFNTRNFKTFRRQLNYYGFVHVRSFNTTGNTIATRNDTSTASSSKSTTALWVNQSLAAASGNASPTRVNADDSSKNDDTDDDIESIASVLRLKRVDGCESVKTSEARRERKELAMSTIEDDLGVSAQFIALQQPSLLFAQTKEGATTTSTTDSVFGSSTTTKSSISTLETSIRPVTVQNRMASSSKAAVCKKNTPKKPSSTNTRGGDYPILPKCFSYQRQCHDMSTNNDRNDVAMTNSSDFTPNSSGSNCRGGLWDHPDTTTTTTTTSSIIKPPTSSTSVANLLLLLSSG